MKDVLRELIDLSPEQKQIALELVRAKGQGRDMTATMEWLLKRYAAMSVGEFQQAVWAFGYCESDRGVGRMQ